MGFKEKLSYLVTVQAQLFSHCLNSAIQSLFKGSVNGPEGVEINFVII